MWNFRSGKNLFGANVRKSDLKYLYHTADITICELHIIQYHGLPFLLKKHRKRYGLLIGAVIWGAAVWYLTGFVWNIRVEVPPYINEYELRQEMKEYGMYEGARLKSFDTEYVKNKLFVNDGRISWITINIMGTEAEIKVSPKTNELPQDKPSASNIKSNANGTVTRIEVRNGTAQIKTGDGIRKGQMLVSGVMEYTDGSFKLVDSEAQIYAKIRRNITLKIPKKYDVWQEKNESVDKLSINIMGLELPLTLNGIPKGNYIMQSEKQQLDLLQNKVPVYFLKEHFMQYTKKKITLNDAQAEKLLKNKLKIYELFMLYSAEKATVLDRQYLFSSDKDNYILSVVYETEEDVAQKSPIQVKQN